MSSKETAKGQHQGFSFTTSEKKKCLEHKTLYSLYSIPPDITKTFTLQGGSDKAFPTFIKILAKRDVYWDFPGSLVVKTPSYQCRGTKMHVRVLRSNLIRSLFPNRSFKLLILKFPKFDASTSNY